MRYFMPRPIQKEELNDPLLWELSVVMDHRITVCDEVNSDFGHSEIVFRWDDMREIYHEPNWDFLFELYEGGCISTENFMQHFMRQNCSLERFRAIFTDDEIQHVIAEKRAARQ